MSNLQFVIFVFGTPIALLAIGLIGLGKQPENKNLRLLFWVFTYAGAVALGLLTMLIVLGNISPRYFRDDSIVWPTVFLCSAVYCYGVRRLGKWLLARERN